MSVVTEVDQFGLRVCNDSKFYEQQYKDCVGDSCPELLLRKIIWKSLK